MANWLKRWLDNLAEENKQAFNGKRLDCCDLNKNNGKNEPKQSNNKK